MDIHASNPDDQQNAIPADINPNEKAGYEHQQQLLIPLSPTQNPQILQQQNQNVQLPQPTLLAMTDHNSQHPPVPIPTNTTQDNSLQIPLRNIKVDPETLTETCPEETEQENLHHMPKQPLQPPQEVA